MMKTKIVGVSHKNPDGSSRQQILHDMKERNSRGERLDLVHEWDNPYDKNAVAIFNQEGDQLGYLTREYAEDVAPMLDQGLDVYAVVLQITGGDGRSFGCNIDLPMLRQEDDEEGWRVDDDDHPSNKKADKIAKGIAWGICAVVALGLLWLYSLISK